MPNSIYINLMQALINTSDLWVYIQLSIPAAAMATAKALMLCGNDDNPISVVLRIYRRR